MNFEKQLGVALHIQMNNGWDQKTYHLSPIHHSRGSSSKRENFHNIWRRGNGPYSRITVILGLIWEYEIPATIDLAGIIVLQVRGLQTVMQQAAMSSAVAQILQGQPPSLLLLARDAANLLFSSNTNYHKTQFASKHFPALHIDRVKENFGKRRRNISW